MKFILSRKIGRPTDSPKTNLLQVRLNNETYNKLNECVKLTNKTRSEIVRKGIDTVYNDIKK